MGTSYPVLKKGDTGAAVEQLQKQLNHWGIQCATDGDFGPATEKAVKQFQGMRQTTYEYAGKPLAPDGICGTMTWAELLKLPVAEVARVIVQEAESELGFSNRSAKTIVTKEQLTHIFGRTPTDAQAEDINNALERFDITTPARIRHFLAQCAHESGGLKWMKELATGDAYEGRRDLGNTQRGDGRKFKGGGMIQTTGRANYQKLADYLGDRKIIDIGCDYVAEHYPATAAAFWWHNNNMNVLCDRNPTVEQVTRRVNGGTRGLQERKEYYVKACDVIV